MKSFIVVLHNVRSLHNVGSIFRTADAAGVDKLYLCGITPTPLNVLGRPEEKLAKVALGAEKNVSWEKAASTSKIISELKKDGFKILALEQAKKSVPYDKFRAGKNQKIALVLGDEVRGLSPTLLKKCGTILEIPMRGKKESLNVSVAFGIAAFELIRRR